MAEKRLDIKVAASATGVEETKRQLKGLGDEAKKAGGGGVRGFFHGLKEQEENLGLKGVGQLLKGAGAFGALSELGHIAAGVAEGLKQYREIIKYGGTKTEALAQVFADSIPIVGETAKGFQSLLSEMFGLTAALEEAQQLLDDDKKANETRAKRDTRRATDLFNNSEAGRKAGAEVHPLALDAAIALGQKAQAEQLAKALQGTPRGSLSPEGKDLIEKAGIKQAFEQAQIEAAAAKERAKAAHDEAILELDRERAKVRGNLAPDQVAGFDANFQKRKNAADFTFTGANAKADATLAEAALRKQTEGEAQAKGALDRRNEVADKRAAVDQKLLSLQEELLQEAGGQNNLEVQRTAIKKKIKEQDQALLEQQRDPNTSPEQKRILGQLREHLPALQRELLSNVHAIEPKNATQLQNTRFLTGVGNPLETTARKTEKNTDEMKRILRDLYSFWQRILGTGAGDTPSFLGPT